MTLKLQIILLVCFVLALLFILNLCRKKKMDLRQGVPWMGALVVVIIFDLFPWLLNSLTKLLGIGSPVNMMVFFGFAFLLIIILIMTVNISKLIKKTTKLTQEVAMLKNEIDKMQDDDK